MSRGPGTAGTASGPGSVACLIPALNCVREIAAVVQGALRYTDTVLVVDDGSTDGTAEAAARAGAQTVSHAENLGKGAALLTGMRALSGRGYTHAVSMDGDGQHPPDEIPLLVEAAVRNPEAMVIGARRVESEPVAAINLFGNQLADWWIGLACGQEVRDSQSGFRVYPLEPTLRLGVRAARFAFESEVLVRAARAGIPIISVPVRTHYEPPERRVSHYRKVRDTVRIVMVVLALLLRLR